MNFRLSNKVFIKICRHDFSRFLFTNQNVNKSSSAFQVVNFHHKNENGPFCFPFSKHVTKQFLLPSSALCRINFQQRNVSNQANFVRTLESEEIAKNAAANMPNFIINMSDWKIVEIAQKTLLSVHDATGLPWWASIALTAWMARTIVTLPFSMLQIHNMAKLQNLQPEMNNIVKRLKQEANYQCDRYKLPESVVRKEYNRKVKKEWNNLIVRDNCHPAKSYILLLIQIPMWFSFSIAIRNLCYMLPKPDTSAHNTFMELMVGGFGWVQNLTVADPYFILPITLGLVNLSILEVYQMFRTGPISKIDRWKTNFLRILTVAMVPIAVLLPAANSVYWLTSSLFGLAQAFLLKSARVHRFCGMRTELEHPYRHLYGKLKSRLRLAEK